jgi:hypothetical protein
MFFAEVFCGLPSTNSGDSAKIEEVVTSMGIYCTLSFLSFLEMNTH